MEPSEKLLKRLGGILHNGVMTGQPQVFPNVLLVSHWEEQRRRMNGTIRVRDRLIAR